MKKVSAFRMTFTDFPIHTFSTAQWLERRSSNTAVLASRPCGNGHICTCHVEVKITSWQKKAIPGRRERISERGLKATGQ